MANDTKKITSAAMHAWLLTARVRATAQADEFDKSNSRQLARIHRRVATILLLVDKGELGPVQLVELIAQEFYEELDTQRTNSANFQLHEMHKLAGRKHEGTLP